jgi:hypothetical protein
LSARNLVKEISPQRENLARRQTYEPNLKKRVTQTLRQKQIESPEEFLSDYKKRKEVRNKNPDPVDRNKQLMIPPSVTSRPTTNSHLTSSVTNPYVTSRQRMGPKSTLLAKPPSILATSQTVLATPKDVVRNSYIDEKCRSRSPSNERNVFENSYMRIPSNGRNTEYLATIKENRVIEESMFTTFKPVVKADQNSSYEIAMANYYN